MIDITADSVVANIPVGRVPRGICYNSVGNKVYCSVQSGGNHPGANDVQQLAPGVYFVQQGSDANRVGKILITK